MKNQKQFGVWMDTQNAVVVGSESTDSPLTILARIKGELISSNSSEKNSNNQVKTVQAKFFKEIASHMLNATHVHITGTGQVQEQFIHYLAATAQFKNSKTAESTTIKMSDEKLIEYLSSKFS